MYLRRCSVASVSQWHSRSCLREEGKVGLFGGTWWHVVARGGSTSLHVPLLVPGGTEGGAHVRYGLSSHDPRVAGPTCASVAVGPAIGTAASVLRPPAVPRRCAQRTAPTCRTAPGAPRGSTRGQSTPDRQPGPWTPGGTQAHTVHASTCLTHPRRVVRCGMCLTAGVDKRCGAALHPNPQPERPPPRHTPQLQTLHAFAGVDSYTRRALVRNPYHAADDPSTPTSAVFA